MSAKECALRITERIWLRVFGTTPKSQPNGWTSDTLGPLYEIARHENMKRR